MDSYQYWKKLGNVIPIFLFFLSLYILVLYFFDHVHANILLILTFQFVYLITTYYRAFLFIYSVKFPSFLFTEKAIKLNRYPTFNILLANYKEKKDTIQQLLKNIELIEYPKDKIKGFLIIQEDDKIVHEVSNIIIPDFIEVLIIPSLQPGEVQSKARALNYALKHCENDIITIFDSEDEPDKLQFLKVCKRFEEKDYDVLQCAIGVYNSNQNFLTRFFSAEFRCFFEYLLNGIDNLNYLKIYPYLPLGGTSFYIKNDMMKKIGKFDMYNPTEDLILSSLVYLNNGKIGYENSVTLGEAPVKISQFLNQRTRWVKGFIISSLVMNRNILKTINKIGFVRWFTFNAWVLGSVFSLGTPLFMLIILSYVIFDLSIVQDLFPSMLWLLGFGGLFIIGTIINIILFAFPAFKRGRIIDVLLTPLFIIFSNIILTISAYRAIFQMIFKPKMGWSKTEHGLAILDERPSL